MHGTIFDENFSKLTRIDMYRAWVIPELYPDEPQPVVKNWDEDDLAMFVGGSKELYL